MYSPFKNNFVIGLISALIVALLSILDYRRKGESVNAGNVFKLSAGVFGAVALVVYLSNYLHTFNKQLGGVMDIDLDTGLPHF